MELPFKLIEVPVGVITYEHCLLEKFYGDIFIGTAERNYYVDEYHEINLCVHYNARTTGKYEFDSKFHCYVTDGRYALKLYWGLGHINNANDIVEYYDSLEASKESKYYEDFIELKKKIETEIERKKGLKEHWYSSFSSCRLTDENKEPTVDAYELCLPKEKRWLQFYVCPNGEWKLSKSKCSVMNMWRFFKDFEKLNNDELHIVEYLPIQEYALLKIAPYHKEYKKVVKYISDIENMIAM